MDGIRKNKILQVTIFNHFASLLSLLIAALLFFGILLYLRFEPDALLIFGIFFLIDAIPALYLHIEYWIKNKGEEYEILDSKIILRKHNREIIYRVQDIETIVIYLSPSLYKNSNFHLLAIESYHFAKIRLKTGDEVILTCLLAPRMDKALMLLKGVSFVKRKRIFCTIN